MGSLGAALQLRGLKLVVFDEADILSRSRQSATPMVPEGPSFRS
jgi:hypothetical protein